MIRIRTPTRAAVVLVLSIGLLVIGAGRASADPARPTNYESIIIEVAPATSAAQFGIVGGDAFLSVRVEPGHDVLILGYSGEPYLHIDGDGSVFVNENSPAFHINSDRYGRVPIPEQVDVAGDPLWVLVSNGGRYAWHDHRAHWMSESRPPTVAGDRYERVFPWEIPVVIDGRESTISGELVWIPSRSPLPPVLVGMFALLPLLFWRPGRIRLPAAVVVASGAIATVVTVAQNNGTPPAARGFPPMVVLSGLAFAAGALALIRAGRSPGHARRAALLGGLALVAWALATVEVLWLPVLPSMLSPFLERAAVASVLWSAAAVSVLAVATIVRSKQRAVGERGVISEPSASEGH